MNEKRRLFISRRELHHHEERIKHAFRDQIAELAGLLEVAVSLIVMAGLVMATIPLLTWMPGLLMDGNGVDVAEFLERALNIVIGVEFIKMLAKHSPGSSLEVLLYAIARHMVVGHGSAVENLISVAAIAVIFIIRRFWFVPSFGSTLPDGKPAPDMEAAVNATAASDAEAMAQNPQPEGDDPEYTHC